jgi:two-component system nitrogen regulation sensor histidine kinase NtrY
MASDTRHAVHRGRPSLERTVSALAFLGGLPAVLAVVALLWQDAYSFEVRWTLLTVVVAVWMGAVAFAHQATVRTLNLVANLLGALREGDYSIRGVMTRPGTALGLVMHEVNDLGSTLQRQRTEAVESTALLTGVMAEIDVALFAFDPGDCLVLVNPAGERLLGGEAAALVGRHAHDLGFEPFLAGEARRLIQRAFRAGSGRWEVRRSVFYRDGRPHQLVVFSDLTRTLREEEQQAWQRIVRVLSHEINNSLTPIKSIAHSLKRMVGRLPEMPRAGEMLEGLSLIETRSGSLGRFLRAYAQLARLPKPERRPTLVAPLLKRMTELEGRVPIRLLSGPDVAVMADQDQLEQLLINVIRNAVDATLEAGGARVDIAWRTADGSLVVTIDDEGPGLSDTSNLFVPFFTTKPNGSGIGLALSRQIAEAHGGSIDLENRTDRAGCRATLSVPIGAPTRG